MNIDKVLNNIIGKSNIKNDNFSMNKTLRTIYKETPPLKKPLSQMTQNERRLQVIKLNPELRKEMLEYQREYKQRPEVKQKLAEYFQEYYQRPEVKQRIAQYQREHYQRPEVKQKIREYYQRPENKQKIREYHQRPEVKQQIREYQQRPEVKQYQREYQQRPEVKEKKQQYFQQYFQEYYQRPEVKQRIAQYQREHYQRPEVKEKKREYYQRPEVKEKKREYQQRPEVKQYQREYYQRPEVKQKLAEYQQRPEVKQQIREYHQRPEVKQRKAQYQREHYQRLEVKQQRLQYQREYYQRPENKQKIREYHQRPEVKQQIREYQQRPEVKQYQREYYQRPEVKEKKREYYQKQKKINKDNFSMNKWGIGAAPIAQKDKIIILPFKKAWEMRKKWAGPAGMAQKRENYTMQEIELGMRKGRFDPIITDEDDYKSGYLTEGKHRLLIAKKLNINKIPVDIQSKNMHKDWKIDNPKKHPIIDNVSNNIIPGYQGPILAPGASVKQTTPVQTIQPKQTQQITPVVQVKPITQSNVVTTSKTQQITPVVQVKPITQSNVVATSNIANTFKGNYPGWINQIQKQGGKGFVDVNPNKLIKINEASIKDAHTGTENSYRGYYEKPTQNIYINRDLVPKGSSGEKDVLLHELGHKIEFGQRKKQMQDTFNPSYDSTLIGRVEVQKNIVSSPQELSEKYDILKSNQSNDLFHSDKEKFVNWSNTDSYGSRGGSVIVPKNSILTTWSSNLSDVNKYTYPNANFPLGAEDIKRWYNLSVYPKGQQPAEVYAQNFKEYAKNQSTNLVPYELKQKFNEALLNRPQIDNSLSKIRSEEEIRQYNDGTPVHKEEQELFKDTSKDKLIGFADGKPVLKLSKGKYPSLQILNKTYGKIDDDRQVPVVMETRKHYLLEYIKNQEKQKGIRFTKQQKDDYIREEMAKLKNVATRFTTYHNKYMPPRVVIFPDSSNNKKETTANIYHEYGHELEERKKQLYEKWKQRFSRKSSPTLYGTTDISEDFAESYAMYKGHKIIINNPNADIKGRLEFFKNNIQNDKTSKNLVSAELGLQEQFNELKKGNKPLVLSTLELNEQEKIKTDMPYIVYPTSQKYSDRAPLPQTGAIFYRPETKQQAEQLKEILLKQKKEHSNFDDKPPDEYHRQVGTLLGYKQEDIEKFIRKGKTFPDYPIFLKQRNVTEEEFDKSPELQQEYDKLVEDWHTKDAYRKEQDKLLEKDNGKDDLIHYKTFSNSPMFMTSFPGQPYFTVRPNIDRDETSNNVSVLGKFIDKMQEKNKDSLKISYPDSKGINLNYNDFVQNYGTLEQRHNKEKQMRNLNTQLEKTGEQLESPYTYEETETPFTDNIIEVRTATQNANREYRKQLKQRILDLGSVKALQNPAAFYDLKEKYYDKWAKSEHLYNTPEEEKRWKENYNNRMDDEEKTIKRNNILLLEALEHKKEIEQYKKNIDNDQTSHQMINPDYMLQEQKDQQMDDAIEAYEEQNPRERDIQIKPKIAEKQFGAFYKRIDKDVNSYNKQKNELLIDDSSKNGGELYWDILRQKGINIDASPQQAKQLRQIFEKRPELIEQAKGLTITSFPNEPDFSGYGYPGQGMIRPEPGTEMIAIGSKHLQSVGGPKIWSKATPEAYARMISRTQVGDFPGSMMAHELQHRHDYTTLPLEQIKKEKEMEIELYNKYPDLTNQDLPPEERTKGLQAYWNLPQEQRTYAAEIIPRQRDIIVPEGTGAKEFFTRIEKDNTNNNKESILPEDITPEEFLRQRREKLERRKQRQEKHKQIMHNWYMKNIEVERQKRKEYYDTHKSTILEQQQKRMQNPEAIEQKSQTMRLYRQRPETRIKQTEYMNRYLQNPENKRRRYESEQLRQQTPEYRKYQKLYAREKRQNSVYREKMNLINRQYYNRHKEEILEKLKKQTEQKRDLAKEFLNEKRMSQLTPVTSVPTLSSGKTFSWNVSKVKEEKQIFRPAKKKQQIQKEVTGKDDLIHYKTFSSSPVFMTSFPGQPYFTVRPNIDSQSKNDVV